MSVATKTLRTLIAAGTSNGVGLTKTSTTWDLRTAFGGLLTIKITNGATGPTVPANVTVKTSGDGTNWKTHRTYVSLTGNNVVSEWSTPIPEGAMYVQVAVSGNTGQAVTCEAYGQEVTSVG